MKKTSRKSRVHLLFAVNSLVACGGSWAFSVASFSNHNGKLMVGSNTSYKRSTRDMESADLHSPVLYLNGKSRHDRYIRTHPMATWSSASSLLRLSASMKNLVSVNDHNLMDSSVVKKGTLKMQDMSMQMLMVDGEVLNMRKGGSSSAKLWYRFKSSASASTTIRYEPQNYMSSDKLEHLEQTDFKLRAITVHETTMNRNPNGMVLHCSPVQDVRDDNEQSGEDESTASDDDINQDASFSKRFKDKFLGRIWRRKDENDDNNSEISNHFHQVNSGQNDNPSLSNQMHPELDSRRDTSEATQRMSAAGTTPREDPNYNVENGKIHDISPTTSLSSDSKNKENLQRRLKLLLEQARSSTSTNDNKKGMELSMLSRDDGSETVPEPSDAYENPENSSSNDITSHVTSGSHSSGPPDEASSSNYDSKQSQREMFLQKERELRQKMGLAGPSKFGKTRQSEQEGRQQSYQNGEWNADDQRSEIQPSSSDDKKKPTSPDSSTSTTVTFDAFGSDPSLQNFKFKELSVNEAKFRSLAPKKGISEQGDNKNLKAFELYLQKEKEMRQKLRNDQSSVEEEQLEPLDNSAQAEDTPSIAAAQNKIDGFSSNDNIYNGDQRSIIWSSNDYDSTGNSRVGDNFVRGRATTTSTSSYFAETELSSFDRRKSDLLEQTELSLEDLNILLNLESSSHLRRLVSKNIPTSDLGAVFRLESILVDTSSIQLESWQTTAKHFNFRQPDITEVQRAVLMRPDVAVRNEFYWSTDIIESQDIANYYVETLQNVFDKKMEEISVHKVTVPVGSLLAEAKYDVRYGFEDVNYTAVKEIFPLIDGAIDWLESLNEAHVPCAVISRLDSAKLDTVLNVTGLTEYFPPELRISAEAGYEWERQEYLGACLRLSQRPEKCVVFESTPTSLRSAHEIGLKVIALMGLYPMYELSIADLAVSSFDELTIFNVRRLFSDQDLEIETQLELEVPEPEVKRKKVSLWTEGDRD